MLRILVIALLALVVVVASAAAQTTTPSQTTTTTQSTSSTSNSNQGAFDKLSPGNQKIAQALFDSQQSNTQTSGSTSSTSTSTASKTYSLDDIAAMKQQKGWGEIFKDLKAKGYYPDYKNLGQVVSRAHHQAKPSGDTTITSATSRGHEEPRIRASGNTLQEAEQALFDPKGGLARGNAAFDARFRDLSLTQADRQKLLQDMQQLSQMPEGSRARFDGRMDGQKFHIDMRNHKGELDVKMNGVQFGSREETQAFMDSLRQGGADRIRIKGMIDGQRFHASFRDHNGKLEQRFQMKEPKDGTVITTGSGRSHVAGAKPKPEVEHGGKYGDDHGKEYGGKSLSSSGSGSSGKSGHGSRGKD